MDASSDSPDQRQRIAEAVRDRMYASDFAAQSLGIRVDAIAPGEARLSMSVRRDMLNGFGICHGGLITTLADTAFAYACNTGNEITVAQTIAVELLASAREGARLVAIAREVTRRGRNGVYDIVITAEDGSTVALMRGRSFTRTGEPIVEG